MSRTRERRRLLNRFYPSRRISLAALLITLTLTLSGLNPPHAFANDSAARRDRKRDSDVADTIDALSTSDFSLRQIVQWQQESSLWFPPTTYAVPPTTLTGNFTDTNNTGVTENDTSGINLNGYTLTYAGTGTGGFNVTGQLTGTAASSTLVMNGTATLTLSNMANTIGGVASFNDGTTLIQGANSGTYAYLASNGGVIGSNSGDSGAVIVSGAASAGLPSSWSTGSASLTIGNAGAGSLTVSNGALVTSGSAVIASNAVAGSLNITGNNSLCSFNGPVVAGMNGTGVLNVTSNGALQVLAGALTLSQNASSASSLIINGGYVTVNGISVGAGATPVIKLTNPTIGDGYALNIGFSGNLNTTLGMVIADAARGDGGISGGGGAGGIAMLGPGILTLTANNTFSGGIQIYGGEVSGGADANFGAGFVALNGGLMRWTGGSETFGRTIGLGGSTSGSGFDIVASAANLTVGSTLSGVGSLTKAGAGALTLTAANPFTGATLINAGQVVVKNALALQNSTVTLNANNGLNVSYFAGSSMIANLGGLAGNGSFDMGGATVIVGVNNADTTYSGQLSNGVNLSKFGTGSLTLTNTANAVSTVEIFSGTTTITGAVSGSRYGYFTSSTVYIADQSGSSATAVVSGSDGAGHASTWNAAGSGAFAVFDVGLSGMGTLNVTNGGSVIAGSFDVGASSDGVGIATISGTDSAGMASTLVGNVGSGSSYVASLFVGDQGTGTLNVASGGKVSNFDRLTIGQDTNSVGTVNVTGTNGSGIASTMAIGTNQLEVGYDGIGSLSVTNGGALTENCYAILGYDSGSQGTVLVSGSDSLGNRASWNLNANALYVGYAGTGTLSITNGGTVSNNSFAALGYNAGGQGKFLVSGSDGLGNYARWNLNSNPLYVGYGGAGQLTVSSGGSVSASTVYLSSQSGSASTLYIEGGQLNVASLVVGAGATPTIKLTNPTLGNGGGYALNLNGSTSFTYSGLIADGTVSDGTGVSGAGGIEKSGSGTVTLTGANTFSGGVKIDGGGTVAGSGTGLGTGLVTIASNGQLGVGEAANTVRAAQSVHALSTGSLSVAAGTSQPEITFNLGASGTSDQLTLTQSGAGVFSASGVFDIGFASATGSSLGAGTYTLMTFSGQTNTTNLPVLSDFLAVPTGNLKVLVTPANPFSYAVNGNIVSLIFSLTSASTMPEPPSLALLLPLAGIGGGFALRRRYNQRETNRQENL